VDKTTDNEQDSYEGGVRGLFKFVPASNKTVYLVSNGKWSHSKIDCCHT
jgi:hypothetical protein